MPSDCITFQNSGYFSKLMVDYLNQDKKLHSLYNRFPTFENFEFQIAEKKQNFTLENRSILVEQLFKQSQNIEISELTKENIVLLKEENTFTITTGHQLNLFSGPIYFIYKIVATIKLCQQLKEKYPSYNFVPVYWMATEDHDFEEINYFKFQEKKISWNRNYGGPVGRLSTEGLDKVFEEFSSFLNTSENAKYLRQLFTDTYLKHQNLTDATRFLVNELFKEQGLVILDGDDAELKKIFNPFAEKELLERESFRNITTNSAYLSDYTIQVTPREINLFYIENGLRERIVFDDGFYKILNTLKKFSKEEILEELHNHPEKFSPNVVLRPLYQEVILPNLCYIGGGGELAYWLQLKSNFKANNITFPMLLLRNSALVVTEKQLKKIDSLQLEWADLFEKQNQLITQKTKEFSNFNIDFSEQKQFLHQQFQDLYKIAEQTDKSFVGAVSAQEKKQLKGLENLEKRLLKAEKRIHTDKLERIISIQNELFPNQSLQERQLNFSEVVLEKDFSSFLAQLVQDFQPLEQDFNIEVV